MHVALSSFCSNGTLHARVKGFSSMTKVAQKKTEKTFSSATLKVICVTCQCKQGLIHFSHLITEMHVWAGIVTRWCYRVCCTLKASAREKAWRWCASVMFLAIFTNQVSVSLPSWGCSTKWRYNYLLRSGVGRVQLGTTRVVTQYPWGENGFCQEGVNRNWARGPYFSVDLWSFSCCRPHEGSKDNS